MRVFLLILNSILLAPAILPTAAQAEANSSTMDFVIVRDGDRIGTSTFRLQHDGRETIVRVVTHVQVKVAFFTVYRFDQTETERWVDGKLVAVHAVTDDNGTPHKVSATARGDMLAVEADGTMSEIDPSLMPVSLWNPALMQKRIALNPQDGKVVPVAVTDHGKEQLVLQGRSETAHHYSIKTNFPQDVWYNDRAQLVKVAMRGSDGSKIEYHPG